jgi:hypothetical protein
LEYIVTITGHDCGLDQDFVHKETIQVKQTGELVHFISRYLAAASVNGLTVPDGNLAWRHVIGRDITNLKASASNIVVFDANLTPRILS